MTTYSLSPDGSTVYRLVAEGPILASSFNTSLLTNGYTATTGSAGSLSLTSYNAGFYVDPLGGIHNAQITALYNFGATLSAGQSLQWVQVVTTNDPAGGASSPYLDNAVNTLQPFYSYTLQNRTSGLPANELNFYDYSGRSPTDLQTVANPINWSAALYPVIVNSNTKSLIVENGISWGWTEKSATVGTDTGAFINPGPPGSTVTGVGTNSFTWGTGAGIPGGAPSSMSFSGGSFNATINTPFDLGTVTYYNGSNTNDADSVTLNISVDLTNVPEKDFTLSVPLTLVNTPNTSDPIASADTVSFGNFGYSFHVEEGDAATVDLYATLSSSLAGSPAGTGTDSLYSPNDNLGSNPNYTLDIVGLKNASTGGFVTTLNIEGTKSDQQVSIGNSISPFAGVTIDDSEINDTVTPVDQTLTVTLSDASNGTLSNLGDGGYDAATGVYLATGTLADVIADLDGLIFTPTPGQSASTSFTLTDTDNYGASTTDSNTSVDVVVSTAPNDFTGNGISDLLWRQSSTGMLAMWLMNGSSITSSQAPTYEGTTVTPGSTWSVAGIGDFNGDGNDDILWRNSNGSLAMWLMDGSTIQSSAAPTYQGSAVSPDSSWSVAGIGDFTGNGDDDILWRQSSGALALWLMNGSTITSSQTVTYQGSPVNPDSSWSVAGIYDSGSFGIVLWRQNNTGDLVGWAMEGGTILGTGNATYQGQPVSPDPSWSLVGLGDFSGDGQTDYLWRNSNGSLAMWLMDGSTIESSATPTYQGSAVSPDSSWNIVEIGDFNGSGDSDILWQQSTTGALVEWQMNGSQIVSSQSVTSQGAPVAPGSTWTSQAKPTDFAA